MREIKLTKGMIAIVDDEIYDYLSQWKWCSTSYGYAGRGVSKGSRSKGTLKIKGLLMHRVIWEYFNGKIPDGFNIDHKDQNKLNNTLDNIRLATRSQNGINRNNFSHNTSGYKGITWHIGMKKWRAQIVHQAVNYHLGYFDDIEVAVCVRRAKEIELFGDYACV